MKKITLKQRTWIRLLNLRKRKSRIKLSKTDSHVALPQKLSLFAPSYRDTVLANIEKIKKKQKMGQCCFIDFHKVETLMPDGTIHLLHQLDKFSTLNIKGRPSKSPIVKAMLSRLGVHQRMGIPKFSFKHHIVDRWYWRIGDAANFGDDFVEIEQAIHDVLQNDDAEFIVNTAISEAVSNVVHHGYQKSEKYKKWILFIGISDTRCDIVISDLGQTIPKTAPKTLGEKIKGLLSINWRELSDADKIKFAATWRKTSTNNSHRGKGFDNIIEVQEVRNDTSIHVLSRKGAWSNRAGLKSYTNPVRYLSCIGAYL